MIINKYIVNKDELDNSKDIFKSHYLNHKKNFNSFDVLIDSKMNGEIFDKIKLSNRIVKKTTYGLGDANVVSEKRKRPCFEYIYDYFFINSFCDEKKIFIFISDFRDMSFYHYLNLPKSMVARKLLINLLQNQSGDYTHEWLPNGYKINYKPTDE